MKKTILLFGMLLSTFAFSQLKQIEVEKCEEVGGIKPMGSTHIVLEKCSEDRYVFTYSDIKYTKINEFKSFALKNEDNAIEHLYEAMMNGMANPPKETIRFELPNDVIELHFVKALGIGNVQIRHWVNKNPEVIGLTVYLDKKKVNKLFGKPLK